MDKKALKEATYIADALRFSGLLLTENVARLSDLADDITREAAEVKDFRDRLENARLEILEVSRGLAEKVRSNAKD